MMVSLSVSIQVLADVFQGKFMHASLIPFHRRLRNESPDCIAEEEKGVFLRFMKRMLCWLPEQRATAKELLEDPWLGG